MTDQAEFVWDRHAEAEQLILALLEQFAAAMPAVRAFAADLVSRSGSRLVDWVDHIVLADAQGKLQRQLVDLGFEADAEAEVAGESDVVMGHRGAILPQVVLRSEAGEEPGKVLGVAIQVAEIRDFLMANRISAAIEGSPLSPYRRARAWQNSAEGRQFLAVERRGHRGFVPKEMPAGYAAQVLRAAERWATRPRLVADEMEGMEQTLKLARSLVSEVGVDTAAWIAFGAERDYWQSRNRAGQVQKARQDSLGLGWANHDHHTFRSSRATFPLLIQILEALGFRARERFYAGAEAGWGAQVMEQPACRFAVFADVDLSPDEVSGDFAHQPLAPREELKTVGMWCALHGQSMLAAGLHHLAGRLSFQEATAGLAGWGIEMMRPFSEFSYLQQAFTKGERWPVAAERLEQLAASGQIDGGQRARFAQAGALGSHLENIQRGEGFKGFNQARVSDIILRTDPRLSAEAQG